MKCKCGKNMIFQLGDEFIELYYCPDCDTFAIKNIECIENIIYLKEIE